jgi:hypothetical protein
MGNSSSLTQHQRLEKRLKELADKINQLETHARFKEYIRKSIKKHPQYAREFNEFELKQQIINIRYRQTLIKNEYDQVKRKIRIIMRREKYLRDRENFRYISSIKLM